MNKKKILAAAFSALMSSAICMCCCTNGFAAEVSGGSVSKGLTAFIMIAVFALSAAAAGFITFRLRTKKLKEAARKDDASGENSPRS